MLFPFHEVMRYGQREQELCGLTVDTSHSLIDLSSDPDASDFESGLHAMVEIPAK